MAVVLETAEGYVALGIAYWLGLAALTWLVDCGRWPPAWLCPAPDKLDTIAQIIPAIVVAVFVFALGAVFVIALRVLRGWLRTVNRAGESRDLQFGLDGVRLLIGDYVEQVRAEPHRFDRQPKDHEAAKNSPLSGADAGRDEKTKSPWFAYELGRALARAVESGVRGNTLRRDLDRLLGLFRVGVQDRFVEPRRVESAEPEWDVVLESRESRHDRIQGLLDKARDRR